MNDIDISAVLTELRRVAGQAGALAPGSPPAAGEAFGEVLGEALSKVNEAQLHAETSANSYTLGEGKFDLPEVMIAQQKARISLEAVIQVRNRFVAAYEEIMNMPV